MTHLRGVNHKSKLDLMKKVLRMLVRGEKDGARAALMNILNKRGNGNFDITATGDGDNKITVGFDLEEKLKNETWRKYEERLRKLEDEYYGEIANNRLEYASKLSETTPVPIADESGVFVYAAYKGEYAYYMDLSADDINELAEKGGYVFRLASATDNTIQGFDQE